jgi:hypothetical protein
MTAEELYPLVTEAIRRAETLEDLRAPGTAQAYREVSLLEEKIAETLPASDPEGAIARRGAVRAALSAREYGRARELVERFLAEDEVGADLREELLELSRQNEKARTARFPHAVTKYGPDEIRRLAQEFVQQEAPFPIG